jgi:hypothetical protein
MNVPLFPAHARNNFLGKKLENSSWVRYSFFQEEVESWLLLGRVHRILRESNPFGDAGTREAHKNHQCSVEKVIEWPLLHNFGV